MVFAFLQKQYQKVSSPSNAIIRFQTSASSITDQSHIRCWQQLFLYNDKYLVIHLSAGFVTCNGLGMHPKCAQSSHDQLFQKKKCSGNNVHTSLKKELDHWRGEKRRRGAKAGDERSEEVLRGFGASGGLYSFQVVRCYCCAGLTGPGSPVSELL